MTSCPGVPGAEDPSVCGMSSFNTSHRCSLLPLSRELHFSALGCWTRDVLNPNQTAIQAGTGLPY